jgi:hypothetical protein
MTSPEAGLADRLVRWMGDNRASLDALMVLEGSRAIHEEFLLAEGGTLPDRATRIERARAASARAWMRHLARAVAAEWPGVAPDLPDRLDRWGNENRERLEALVLEEAGFAERRGASGDPHADRRDVDLAAHARLFAEGLATIAGPLGDRAESPADFGRRVAAWSRANESRRREVEREALAAWGSGPPPEHGPEMTAAAGAPEPDEMRIQEAAAVWAHVRLLAEALEHARETPPETPA